VVEEHERADVPRQQGRQQAAYAETVAEVVPAAFDQAWRVVHVMFSSRRYQAR
jgi:hypothetical protein